MSLAGTIGRAAIRAHLDTGNESRFEHGVFGAFVYTATWSPSGESSRSKTVALDGQFSKDCRQFELEESNESGDVTATWTLSYLTDKRLVGTRHDDDSSDAAIELDVVRPVDCAPHGKWQRFSSPSWPVTFEYPATWRLGEDRDGLLIQCADPGRLAIGYQGLWVRKGSGSRDPDRSVRGRSVAAVGAFTRFEGRGWWHGDACDGEKGDEDAALCAKARVSRRDGMTILYGTAIEHRLYRAGGGYIGAGGGMVNYAFLLPGAWVDILSDVVDTDPGVTARVIRSVKPAARRR